MAYYLDANVFIEANRRYYGLDFCPAFWDWLLAQHAAGKVFSVQAVARELARGDDELKAWTEKRGARFFIPPQAHVGPRLEQVQSWASSQNYAQSAIAEFLESADHYLISQALADDRILVTHEIPSNSKNRVKIPNVCEAFNIRYWSLFKVLRHEKAKFVLAKQPRTTGRGRGRSRHGGD